LAVQGMDQIAYMGTGNLSLLIKRVANTLTGNRAGLTAPRLRSRPGTADGQQGFQPFGSRTVASWHVCEAPEPTGETFQVRQFLSLSLPFGKLFVHASSSSLNYHSCQTGTEGEPL